MNKNEKKKKDGLPIKEVNKQANLESEEIPDGLNQFFINKDGITVNLKDFLVKGDWWTGKGSGKKTLLLTHSAVEKIAKVAGLTVVDYIVKTQPDCYNNYQYTVQATMHDSRGNTLKPEWGEANRSNLGTKGRNNPANMAQKRAFDRTVLRGLGITNILSEEELSEEDKDEKMNNLEPEKAREIAPLINQILLIKTKGQLSEFSQMMSREKVKYIPEQMDAVRKVFKLKSMELNKLKF